MNVLVLAVRLRTAPVVPLVTPWMPSLSSVANVAPVTLAVIEAVPSEERKMPSEPTLSSVALPGRFCVFEKRPPVTVSRSVPAVLRTPSARVAAPSARTFVSTTVPMRLLAAVAENASALSLSPSPTLNRSVSETISPSTPVPPMPLPPVRAILRSRKTALVTPLIAMPEPATALTVLLVSPSTAAVSPRIM